MKDTQTLNQICEVLDGSTGIIYLMFLGRETYTAKIQEPLLNAGIFMNKETVNQNFERLKEHEDFFLRFIEEKKAAGKPQIYTANIEPIIATLVECNVSFKEEKLRRLLTTFSFLNDYFPKYFKGWHTRNNKIDFSHKTLKWTNILSAYFMFLFTNLQPINDEFPELSNAKLRKLVLKLKLRPQIFSLSCVNHIGHEKVTQLLHNYQGGLVALNEDLGMLLNASLRLLDGSVIMKLLDSIKQFVNLLGDEEQYSEGLML